MGNVGIPQRRKMLSQYLKEEPKERFVGRRKLSSKALRQERAWKIREVKTHPVFQGLSEEHRE